MRNYNSDRSGCSFSPFQIAAVWVKARPVPGYDPTQIRQDNCGATIHYSDYGKTTTYGWEIDHIRPVAKGGSDDLSNLQALWWGNNRHKSDNWPHWTCAYVA